LKASILALSLLALVGCKNIDIKAEKTLDITPGDKQARATATTVCKDYVFYQRCWLNVDVQPVK
jgi:hypothetical protein